MSLTVLLNGTNVAPTNVRLRANGDQGVGGLAQSADGVGSQGAIVFDDSDSTLAVAGWDPVIAVEAECVTAPRLFTGWIADHTEQRGDHYLLDGGREIDCSINDTNVLLSNIVVTGSDGNRPAETDAQTIAWLLSTYLSGIVYDLGLVNPPPRNFDAADYRTMSCAEILAALVAPRGQIFFTYWDQAANKIGLFYDSPTATAFTSTLSISNVLADVDNVTVFAPFMDDEQTFDPSEVYCQCLYLYKGGRLLTHNATTHAAFFAGIGHRTLVVENDRVGLKTTAQTFSDRILTQAGEERPLLRFTVLLPATKVGLIQAGMRLAVRFSHLTGFTASTYTRVERLTVAPVASDTHLYEMNLECSTHGPITPIGGGSTTGFPPKPEAPTYDDCIINARGAGTGHIDSDEAPPSGNGVAIGRIQFYNGDQYEAVYTVTQATDDGGSSIGTHWQETGGGGSFGGHSFGHPTGTVGPVTETFTVSGVATPSGSPFHFQGDIDTDLFKSALDFRWCCVLSLTTAGPDNPNVPTGDPAAPTAGTPIIDEFVANGDGTTVTFTTDYPYSPLSLRVKVDGVQIILGLTETSPTAGTFTLDFAPLGVRGDVPAEKVTVSYIASGGAA